jgi:hypothetical protein
MKKTIIALLLLTLVSCSDTQIQPNVNDSTKTDSAKVKVDSVKVDSTK